MVTVTWLDMTHKCNRDTKTFYLSHFQSIMVTTEINDSDKKRQG